MTQFTDGQTRVIETLQMRADDLAKAVLHFIPKSEHRTTLCRMLDAPGRRLRRSGNNRRRRMIEMVVLAVTGLTLCLLAYGVGSLAVTLVEMWSNRYEP